MHQAIDRGRRGVGLVATVLLGGSLAVLPSIAPVQAAASAKAAAPVVQVIEAGSLQSTCALTNGVMKCWGRGGTGVLGIGVRESRNHPVKVPKLGPHVRGITIGTATACALLSNWTVKCWGRNKLGQIGDGTRQDRLSPVPVKSLGKVRSVSAGNDFACAVTWERRLKCWGSNISGQLGDGSTKTRILPVSVKGISNVKAVYPGGFSTCAISMTNIVRCWGRNLSGQLGTGNFKQSRKPVRVQNLGTNVKQLTNGWENACVVLKNGAAKCWGSNLHGQVGDNTDKDRKRPTNVTGLGSGVKQISAGTGFVCAIVMGGAKCWGANTTGQIGDGTTDDVWVPTQVTGITSGVKQVSAGWQHTCATINSGPTKCWGDNFFGSLGNRTWTSSLVPVNVSW